jgi:hypothetical protein
MCLRRSCARIHGEPRARATSPFTVGGQRIVVIGHRATFYALEHLIRGIPLLEVMTAPWRWQPGCSYSLSRD